MFQIKTCWAEVLEISILDCQDGDLIWDWNDKLRPWEQVVLDWISLAIQTSDLVWKQEHLLMPWLIKKNNVREINRRVALDYFHQAQVAYRSTYKDKSDVLKRTACIAVKHALLFFQHSEKIDDLERTEYFWNKMKDLMAPMTPQFSDLPDYYYEEEYGLVAMRSFLTDTRAYSEW